jgi:hypothetical protein
MGCAEIFEYDRKLPDITTHEDRIVDSSLLESF